jgi:hypothetical protein
MQFYWSLKSIPELSGLSLSERRRAWRAAYCQSYNHWQTWVSVVGVGLFMMIGSTLGARIGHQSIGELIGWAPGALSSVRSQWNLPGPTSARFCSLVGSNPWRRIAKIR